MFLKNLFNKKQNKSEIYAQVVGDENDLLILNKIGEKGQIKINIDDLPDNIYKCGAYKITIEPIEHTFANPCEAWKKAYKPKIVDKEARTKQMKTIFGINEEN